MPGKMEWFQARSELQPDPNPKRSKQSMKIISKVNKNEVRCPRLCTKFFPIIPVW